MPIRQLTAIEEEHFEGRGRILLEAMINPTIDETNERNVDNNLRTTSGWSMQSLGARSTAIKFDPLRGLQAPEETRRQLPPSRRPGSVGQSWTNTAHEFKYDILLDPAYCIIIGADGYGPSGWNGGDHKPAVPEVQSNDPRDVLCWSDMATEVE
ncbi:hypothetical protein Slin14017_G107150 [Septoria linicola]|nr:hypothetical protein Slin14017_G107150 [Septoria linicola]